MATVASFPKIICRVKALYAFSSTETSSLSFEKGDFIDVLSQLDSGWWDGWCNGKRGWFPSNYVQLVDSISNSLNTRPLPQPPQQRQPQHYGANSMKNMNIDHDNTNKQIIYQDEEENLPEGWKLQIAEDGHTKFYFNQHTGGLRWNHPGISDSDEEREDSITEEEEHENTIMNDYDFGHSTPVEEREEYHHQPQPPIPQQAQASNEQVSNS